MTTWSSWSTAAVLTALCLGSPNRLRAQSDSALKADSALKVDPALAEWGKRVWNAKQCSGCHQLGKEQGSGPDLIGVTDRRLLEWIRAWLTDPVAMTGSDPVAAALKQQYRSQMPNFHLTPHEIDGLISYLAQETAKRATK
jgi:protein SCO1/2